MCAPDDGWRYHPKYVEQFSRKKNELCKVASRWKCIKSLYVIQIIMNPLKRTYLFSLEEKHVQRRTWFQTTTFITLIEINSWDNFLFIKQYVHYPYVYKKTALCLLLHVSAELRHNHEVCTLIFKTH